MPNCTGAESVHSSVRKCLSKRKVDLIKACEMDQNRAIALIAAYTSYLNGAHQGKDRLFLSWLFGQLIL
jgi:hypothetical protein